MEYACPIEESTEFLCDREAVHLVAGTAICRVHAKIMSITLEKLAAALKKPANA
jgi:hypothetical protein